MQVLICPECGSENLLEAQSCEKCAASLADVSPVEGRQGEVPFEEEINHDDHPESDLPELLHALKQSEDADGSEDDRQNEGDESLPDADAIFGPEEVIEDDDVPEWLQRIRERAVQEEDSVGEITQKISAAKESLEESVSKDQRENFESWIQQLRDQAGQSPDQQISADAGEGSPDDIPEWLLKIRQESRPPDQFELSEEGSDTDTAGKDLPGWLVLSGQVEEEQASEEETRQIAVSAEDVEDDETQEVDTSELEDIAFREPMIAISREEQTSIDQLTATIADEQAVRTTVQPVKRPSIHWGRLILGLLMIVALSLSLFFDSIPGLPPGQTQPYNLELLNWAESLTNTTSLLIVLDYQAGFSNELKVIASPIIQNSLTEVGEISLLSSSPPGSLLFTQLVSELDGANDIVLRDLGYFPIPAYGAYHLGMQSDASWRFAYLPQSDNTLPSEGYDGILILADTFEGSSAWVEQLSSLMPDIPLHLLVTAQAGPLLLPYVASGQVKGMISGISEAVSVISIIDQSDGVSPVWQAYQVGILLVMVVMVIGAVFPWGKRGRVERQKKA